MAYGYSPQTWVDDNVTYPLSAARMSTLEAGVQVAATQTQHADYTIFYDGANWNARDNRLGTIPFSGANFAIVFNQASAALTAYGLAYTHTINGGTCSYAFPPAVTFGTIANASTNAVDGGDHFYCYTAVSANGESMIGYQAATNIGWHTTVNGNQTSPGSGSWTLTVVSTTGFPSSGTISAVDSTGVLRAITYTSTTSTTFAGCTGGTGRTYNSGAAVRSTVTSVVLNSIATGPAGTTARKVYRSLADAPTIATAREPDVSELFLLTTIADNVTQTYTDTTSDSALGVAASTLIPTFSDAGSIAIGRFSGTTSGVANAIAQTQALQLYTGQSLFGAGRATQLIAQTAYLQTYGTCTLPSDTTTTSLTVTESATPPVVPFAVWASTGVAAGETMLVTARSGVSNPFTYTVQRGYGSLAVATGGAGTLKGNAQGRGGMGAQIDAYNADRVRIDGVAVSGGLTSAASRATYGLLHKRTTSTITGGQWSTSYIQNNDFENQICGILIGLPNDASATANVWVMFNRINSKTGPALGMYIGDGHYRLNNIVGGLPGILSNSSTWSLTDNHITDSGAGSVMITAGQRINIKGNYFDNLGPYPGGAIVRPSGFASLNGYLIEGNYFNCRTLNTGDTPISLLSTTNGVAIVGNIYGRTPDTTAGIYLVKLSGGSGCIVEGNTTTIGAIAYDPAGIRPSTIGNNVSSDGKLTRNDGSQVASGTGALTTFSWNHLLTATPTRVNVTAGSTDAKGDYWVTVSSTQITVNYAVAPANGASNLTWYWEAGV